MRQNFFIQLNIGELNIPNHLASLYVSLPVIDYTPVSEAINKLDLTNRSNG